MEDFHVSLKKAKEAISGSESPFKEVFAHGTLSVELYQPDKIDHQTPHERDEVYIIAEGSGKFHLENEYISFEKGDFLFVPAGKEHRFESFTADFSTWVLFYGPKGGETDIQ
mgnify:CR=1 FL=1